MGAGGAGWGRVWLCRKRVSWGAARGAGEGGLFPTLFWSQASGCAPRGPVLPCALGPEPVPRPLPHPPGGRHRLPAALPDPLQRPASLILPRRISGRFAACSPTPSPQPGLPPHPLVLRPDAPPSVGSEDHSSREGRWLPQGRSTWGQAAAPAGISGERLASAISWPQRKRPANEDGQLGK